MIALQAPTIDILVLLRASYSLGFQTSHVIGYSGHDVMSLSELGSSSSIDRASSLARAWFADGEEACWATETSSAEITWYAVCAGELERPGSLVCMHNLSICIKFIILNWTVDWYLVHTHGREGLLLQACCACKVATSEMYHTQLQEKIPAAFMRLLQSDNLKSGYILNYKQRISMFSVHVHAFFYKGRNPNNFLLKIQ